MSSISPSGHAVKAIPPRNKVPEIFPEPYKCAEKTDPTWPAFTGDHTSSWPAWTTEVRCGLGPGPAFDE